MVDDADADAADDDDVEEEEEGVCCFAIPLLLSWCLWMCGCLILLLLLIHSFVVEPSSTRSRSHPSEERLTLNWIELNWMEVNWMEMEVDRIGAERSAPFPTGIYCDRDNDCTSLGRHTPSDISMQHPFPQALIVIKTITSLGLHTPPTFDSMRYSR